ncbi:XRE family transcriptional regulator [Luteibacter sp.]|uniref:XRE family transcriptional regulator n=1 Tax=Luteibacter sp. TaxID=1886636 RepID=UPI002F3F19D6
MLMKPAYMLPAMSTLAERIIEARTDAGISEPAELARLVGVKAAAAYQWESGATKSLKDTTLVELADVLKVTPRWLATGKAPKKLSDSQAVARFETRDGYVRFPLLEGFAGMGRGDYVGDYPEIVEFVEVTREWVATKLRNVPHEAIRVITGRGQSMRGMYDDGDLIFIDSRVKEFVDDAAYVFRFGGRVQVKRLQWRGGKLRILSANPAYDPLDVDKGELEIGGLALAAWTLKEF